MRFTIAAGAVVFLASFGYSQEAGDKKGAGTPWAQVTVGGEIRDLIDLCAKLDVLALLDRDIPAAALATQWRGPLPPRTKKIGHIRSMQVGTAAWIVALLDDTDPELDQTLPRLTPMKGSLRVALTGILAASTDKDPFVVHANAAGTIRIVEKDDKASPQFGEIQVTGRALPGKYEIGKGKFTTLAIENGPSPILIVGKADQINEAKGKILVSGRLIIAKNRPLVVEAKSISAAVGK